MQLQAVRTLTVRGQSQGLDKVRADLDAVSASQQGVAQSSTAMATASETSARRQLSAAGAFERLIERNDRMVYLQRQLEREMNIVNRAHEQGAIDATRHADAVDMLAAKYARLTAEETKARAAASGVAAPAHGGSFNTANIAAQFQDIGVTTAMGMNPLQIALQQGTQLSAVLETLKGQGKSAGAALLGAFTSLINPVSLVTIGVIAAGSATAQWLMSTRAEVKSADDALEAHKKLIGEVKDLWKGAEAALESYSQRNQTLVAASARMNVTEMQRQMQEATSEFINSISVTLTRQVSGIDAFLIEKEFAPFTDAITRLRDEAKAGAPDFDTFYKSINTTVSADENLRPVADKLLEASGNAEALWRNLQQAGVAARVASDAITAMVNASHGLLQQDSTVGFALGSQVEGDRSAQAHKIELDAINAKSPAQLADIARRREALQLDGEAITEALKKQKIEQAGELAYAQAAAARAEEMSRERAANDNLVKSLEDRVAKAEFDLTLVGKTADEQARLRIEFELTNQAAGKLPVDQLQKLIDREIAAEKATRDTTKAADDQKKALDQLAGSAQTLFGALTKATGISDNPLVMGVEGALGPLMKGDWIGAAIAGITNLFVGYIEMEKKRQEAIKAANDNRATIGGFIAKGYGREVDETAIALENYRKQAAQYIELARAAGDTALVHRLERAAAAYRDTLRAQERIDRLTGKVDADRDRLRDAYERESSALRDVIDRSKAFVESMQDFKKSLLLDGALSPLSPQDRLLQAQSQFNQTSTAALNGDAAAQSRLQDAATAYLEQARNFYASSSGYASIFDQVQSVLDRAIASGTSQVSDAERQLSKLDDQVSKLIDINTSVVSVADAIKKLNADMMKLLAAQIDEQKETNKTVKQQAREASQNGGRRAA